jgi:hypothetical protein
VVENIGKCDGRCAGSPNCSGEPRKTWYRAPASVADAIKEFENVDGDFATTTTSSGSGGARAILSRTLSAANGARVATASAVAQ